MNGKMLWFNSEKGYGYHPVGGRRAALRGKCGISAEGRAEGTLCGPARHVRAARERRRGARGERGVRPGVRAAESRPASHAAQRLEALGRPFAARGQGQLEARSGFAGAVDEVAAVCVRIRLRDREPQPASVALRDRARSGRTGAPRDRRECPRLHPRRGWSAACRPALRRCGWARGRTCARSRRDSSRRGRSRAGRRRPQAADRRRA